MLFYALEMALTACVAAPAPTLMPSATPTGALAPAATDSPATPAPTAASPQTLRLWLPPQFAPDPSTPGGKALLSQLDEFEKQHAGVQVEVRVKKTTGQGGLLNSLQAAMQVAPGAAPDVIALSNPMLLSAASLAQPLDGALTDADLADFYPFALQSARVESHWLALPFAADVIGLAYSTSAYAAPPVAWRDMPETGGPLWLPLADPAARVTLQQYVALGGALTDEAGNPVIDATLLATVLAQYQSLQTAGLLPEASATVDDPAKTWAAYRENRAAAAAASLSDFLADRQRVVSTGFAPLPTPNGARVALASQWNYVLITSDPARQAVAFELMKWLTAPENLGPWALASAVLPARPQALARWPNTGLRAIAADMLSVAQPEPSATLLAAIGPPVAAAVQAVLSGQSTPLTAANTAAATVAGK